MHTVFSFPTKSYRLPVFAILSALILILNGQEPLEKEEPLQLTELRNKWISAKLRQISPLKRNYQKDLKALALRFTKIDRLEDAIIVTKEIEALSKGETLAPDKTKDAPYDLKLLKSNYLKNLQSIEKKTDKIYTGALKNLQREAAKDGVLTEAIAYQKEAERITKLSESKALPTTTEGLKEWIVGTKWKSKIDSKIYTFTKEGKFTTRDAQPSYEITGPLTVLVKWSSNTKLKCKFDKKLETLTETNGDQNTFKRLPK